MSLAEILDTLAGPFCHQLTSRVIHVDDSATALCARCTGFHLSFALAFALGWGRFPTLDARRLALVSLALGVTVADALLWNGGEAERFLTGSAGGAGLALAAGAVWYAPAGRPRTARGATLLCLLGAPVAAALLYSSRTIVGALPLSIGALAGLFGLLTLLVTRTPRAVLGPLMAGKRDP